jgi:hypothetical protein
MFRHRLKHQRITPLSKRGMGRWPVSVTLAAALLPFLVQAEAHDVGTSAAAISVRITSQQNAIVTERYPFAERAAAASLKFVYLLSPSTRITNLHISFGSKDVPYSTWPSGAWVHLTAELARSGQAGGSEIRVTYDIQDVAAAIGRDFTLPICMPSVSLDTLEQSGTDEAEISVEDTTGASIQRIILPRLMPIGSGIWRANLPAVPSWVIVRRTNARERATPLNQGPSYPIGKFNRNFWGLVITLVTWTIVYLVWAIREKRPSA